MNWRGSNVTKICLAKYLNMFILLLLIVHHQVLLVPQVPQTSLKKVEIEIFKSLSILIAKNLELVIAPVSGIGAEVGNESHLHINL